jgi:serine phosphatase RsbU (regulator of sigma subunit)
MTLLCLAVLIKIGEGITGLFWYYLFAPFSIFILGKYNGSIYILIVLIFSIILMNISPDFMTFYPTEIRGRFVISFLSVSIISFVFEAVREATYKKFIEADKAKTQLLIETIEQKEEILQQNEEIVTQKETLEQINSELINQKNKIILQNEFIKGSINYAQTIQNATLPSKLLLSCFFDNFIIYKPKDIVSGDFYWFVNSGDTYYLAVADSTGHGVPGAFMSMIGSRLLDEIVLVKKIDSPEQILSSLDLSIKNALKQDQTKNDDGMDICLCKIYNNKITFSGAKRPLFFKRYEDTEFQIIKGGSKRIGGKNISRNQIIYSEKILEISSETILYLTSDGFVDQNDYDRRRFGTKKFVNLLNNIFDKSMDEQKIILENNLSDWQKNEPQRDDITIIGIEIPYK